MIPLVASLSAVLCAWTWLHWGVLTYVLHYPDAVSAAVFGQLLKALARTAVLAWIVAAAAALGRRVLKPLALRGIETAEQLLLEIALGLGFLSYLLFVIGLLGLWTPVPLAVLCALLSIHAGLTLDVRSFRTKGPSAGEWDWPRALFAVPILLAVLYALTSANAPPTDWDSLAVHLEIPRQYARLGALAPLRWLLHGFDPMAIELLYVPALVFKDAAMPAMIATLFEGLMCAALWVCGRRIAPRPVAWAAAALFVSQPAVLYVSGTPGTDFGVGFFAMLAFWTAWRAKETGNGRWLLVSGALSGLAAASKTTGIFFSIALAVLLLNETLRGEPRVTRRELAAWAGAAALFCAPWLLRSFLCTGNPVWPFLPGIFGGGARGVYLYARGRAATTEGFGRGWLQLAALPLNLIFRSGSFRHSSRLLMIPLTVLGAASWRQVSKRSFARWVLIYAGLFALLWFQAVQEWRYFIPVMPWLCLLTCAWAANAWRGGYRDKALAAALAVGFLGIPSMSANNALFPVLGLRPGDSRSSAAEAYLTRTVDSYAAMELINRAFPRDAKILLYGEIRPFYLDRGYLIGDPQNEVLIRYENLRTPEELDARLRELGVTHVLVDPFLQSFRPDLPAFRRADGLLRAFLQRRARRPLDVNGVLIYAI